MAKASRVKAKYIKEDGSSSPRTLIGHGFQNVLAIDVSGLSDLEADTIQKHYDDYLACQPTFQAYLDERGINVKPQWKSFKIAGLSEIEKVN